MQRPFAWTTTALLAGAALVSLHEFAGRFLPFAFLIAWLLALALTAFRKKFLAVFFTLASSFFLGACLYLTGSYKAAVPDRLAQEYCFDQPRPAQLRGFVSELNPSTDPEARITFVLEVREIARADSSEFHPVDGRAQVNWYQAGRALREGDYVEVSGKIRRLKGFKNPDTFDYEKFMYRRGIYTRMAARGPNAVGLLRELSLSAPGGWRYLLRQKGMEILSSSTRSFETNAFLSAILLGERALLTDEMKDWFKETGTFHILSISGLHIGLVYLIASLALTPLSPGMKTRTAIALVIVWAYALVTGADVPVMRASIMLTLVLVGYLLDREGDFLTAIALAAFVLFIFDPLSIDDVSFQLSFAAVVLLCSFEPVFSGKLYPLLQRALPSIPSAVMHKFSVTLFASAVVGTGLTPIIAYHFNQISLVFPLANLLVVPLLSIALALGFGCIVAGFISAKAAVVVGLGAELVCQTIFGIVRVFSRLPFSSMYIASPPLWVIFAVAVAIFFLYWKTDWRKRAAILGCIVCVGFLSATTTKSLCTNRFRAIFFDVGDADSCLLEFPGSKKILIDTGFSTPSLDCGESLIAPFLWRNNIRKLDAVVLTHPDSDHCGGARFLLENFFVSRLILPDSEQMRQRFATFIELASSRGASVEFLKAGDVLSIAPLSQIEVLHPPAAVPPGQYSDNDLSLVLKVSHRDLTMLFSGDATKESFDMMESRGISTAGAILKAPHHGLLSSYDRRFVERVKPELTIISGRAFRSNDSIRKRISRYAPLCPQVFSTEENGAVVIEHDQRHFVARGCRKGG